MNNRLPSIGIVCLLVTVGFFGFITLKPRVVNAAGIIIYVDDDNVLGPWIGTLTNPYNKIQDGVNASNPGDTVFVFNGTYYENVVVDRAINLTGENRDITIIDGGGSEDTVYVITDWVYISGFTIKRGGSNPGGGAGIKLYNVQNCSVLNNNASFNLRRGIYLYESSNNDIIDNIVFSNDWDGIELFHSSANRIVNNDLSWNHRYAIRIWVSIINDKTSNNNIIANNNISNNHTRGIDLEHSSNNIITNNNVSSNVIGIDIINGRGNSIIGNNVISNNRFGICLAITSSNNIIDNNFINNNLLTSGYAGIEVHGSSDNRIINNNISSDILGGIYLSDAIGGSSDNNIISNNTISLNNGHGIHLDRSSSNNIIEYNNVSNNLQDGIYLEELGTSYNDIIGNDVTSNINSGITIFGANNNNITDNNVRFNRNDGIYLYSASNINIKNNIVSNSINGIHLESSIDSIVTGNDCSNNYHGIYLESLRNNDISDNNVYSNTGDGIHLDSSRNNTMTGNYVSINENGFALNYSYDNTIIGNTVYLNSWYGVDIINKGNNTIYHNNFIDNNGGVQARDNMGTNHWNDSYPSGGNYWNDWTTPDTKSGPNQDQPGSDDIVDFPYSLDGGVGAKDYYPFAIFLDILPPIITNLQPPDASITNDNTSTISADYSDPSGINVSSVVLIVDGLDVTFSATVTANGVSYIPGTALSDGIHTVYLKVKDNVDNLATETWSFTVDTLPPIITNLQPPDSSTLNGNIPTIGADYSDPSGINVSSVVLIVDGLDVTLSATVTANGVSYIPVTALSDGIHTVYLEVKDNVDNLATATWSFTVITALPPATNLTTKVVNNGNNVELEWDPPSSLALDHYLIYRADSATEFDFTTPHNISTTWPNPKNTTWVDPDPNVLAVDDDFYYIIRAANFDESIVSLTSNTAGVWTRTFESGISTFSLPLEPFVKKDTEFYCQDMNASYIKWMNQTTHTWMRHDKGSSENNTLVEVGKGYEVGFLGKSIQTKYTFTGMPGAMILYDNVSFGFDATPLTGDADSLTATADGMGNVTLNWTKPTNIGSGDQYYVLRSNLRDGFWGTLGVNYTQLAVLPFNILSYQDIGNATPGTEYCYMIVPVNLSTSERGVSSYSIGVWTAGYLDQYDTFALPLRMDSYQTADWYCDNIQNTVGINYYNVNTQQWCWHSTRMPKGAFDPFLVMTEGYQISTSNSSKFTFIGW